MARPDSPEETWRLLKHAHDAALESPSKFKALHGTFDDEAGVKIEFDTPPQGKQPSRYDEFDSPARKRGLSSDAGVIDDATISRMKDLTFDAREVEFANKCRKRLSVFSIVVAIAIVGGFIILHLVSFR